MQAKVGDVGRLPAVSAAVEVRRSAEVLPQELQSPSALRADEPILSSKLPFRRDVAAAEVFDEDLLVDVLGAAGGADLGRPHVGVPIPGADQDRVAGNPLQVASRHQGLEFLHGGGLQPLPLQEGVVEALGSAEVHLGLDELLAAADDGIQDLARNGVDLLHENPRSHGFQHPASRNTFRPGYRFSGTRAGPFYAPVCYFGPATVAQLVRATVS